MNRLHATPRHAGRQGIALVTTLLVVSIVGVLVAGSLILSITNQRISRNDATSSQAFYAAQAGNAFWRAELVSLYQFMIQNFELYEDAINDYIQNGGGNISCGNYLAIGVDVDRDGTIDITTGSRLPAIEVPVGNSTATVRTTFDVNGSAVQLDGRSSVNGGIGRVVERFNISNVDLWNNAVFADTGAANATIQGRAEIRGAIHILGEGLAPTDMALDVSGSFGLGNTYRNLNSSLNVNSNSMRLTQDDPQDLCATLRVRSGYVLLGGSAQIGYDEDDTAEPYIDRMRGIYTNDGFQGGSEDSNIFSENGMYAAYDAGDSYRFPGLSDLNDDGITYAQALKDNALKLHLDLAGGGLGADDDRANALLPNGDPNKEVYLVPTTSSAEVLAVPDGKFYITATCMASGLFGVNADGTRTSTAKNTKKNNGNSTQVATGFVLTHDQTPDFTCIKKQRVVGGEDPVVTEITWDESSNELYIGGKGGVMLLKGGDVLISGSNSSGTEIGYLGEGILFAEDENEDGSGAGGNVELEVDILPAATDHAQIDSAGARIDPATIFDPDASVDTNSYPATTILGVAARKSVINSGSQKRFTAAIYADESVSVSKQTLVAGAIVTRTFDAGSNVPTVLYVPNLAERLPELMPGAGGLGFSVSNVSFSRQ